MFAQYIGIPYVDKGRDPQGWDCWGLVRYCLEEHFGLVLPSFDEEYVSARDIRRVEELYRTYSERDWRKLTNGQERPGDVVHMRLRNRPIHVGLVIGEGYMLHVEEGVATAAERYKSLQWKDRVLGIYRYEPASNPSAG